MINLSIPDTIDERTINKKKLTPFTIQVIKSLDKLSFIFKKSGNLSKLDTFLLVAWSGRRLTGGGSQVGLLRPLNSGFQTYPHSVFLISWWHIGAQHVSFCLSNIHYLLPSATYETGLLVCRWASPQIPSSFSSLTVEEDTNPLLPTSTR